MQFVKSTLIRGFVVLFPILLFGLALKEMVGLLVTLAEPIAELLPEDAFGKVDLPGLIAVALMVLASFIIGLLVRSGWLTRIGKTVEQKVLLKMPMYEMLKLFSNSFIKTDTSAVQPAMLKSPDGGGDPCYIVERHANGLVTVLLPWSPASFAGAVKVVRADRIEELDCTLESYSLALSLMGVGVESCMATASTATKSG